MGKISYDKIKELFIKYGYLPNDDLIWRTYIGIMQTIGGRKVGQDVYAICLDGPAGTGKSSFAIVYSKVLEELTGEKISFIKYTCNDKTGKEETFEDVNLVAAVTHDANKLIIPGFVAKAIEECNKGNRVILRVDEYDKAKPVEDSFLLEFLQEGSIYTSQFGELKLEDPSKLQVILCKNDNRSQLSYPLTRRLNFIELEYTTPSDMAEIVGMKMKEQDPALKVLIVMMYSSLYNKKDDYTRIPSASEVMIAIDEADILTKGGAPKEYVYKSIIKNLLKTKVDIQTFLSGNQRNGKLDEGIEELKSVFANNASSPFDKESLLLDLYEMYFKPIAEEYNQQLKKSLNDICDETNEFKSATDYKLRPLEVGEKNLSKFDISNNWFLLGNVEATEQNAESLVRMCDEERFDGPIFIVDDDYFIIAVKEKMGANEVNIKFLCNKPAVPTAVVCKLKELVQFMDSKKHSFAFPLVTSYKVDKYSEKQKGFYEYSTDYRTHPINEAFNDITEVKLNFIKMGNTKIIEGNNVPIQDFGRGDKAIIKSGANSIQLDVINNGTAIQEIGQILPINLKKPLQVTYGRKERIEFNPETFISKIKIRSKKKGNVTVNGFEPDYIVKYLNNKNREEADKINDELLSIYSSKKTHSIFHSLDESQRKFLDNFVDDSLSSLNINDAISNCIDYAIENDILNPNTGFVKPRNVYDCLSPDPKVFTLRLNHLDDNKRSLLQ